MYQQSPDIGSRIASAFLDHVLGLILKIIVWLPAFLFVMNSGFNVDSQNNLFSFFTEPEFIFSFISVSSLYYLKDVFNGRSPGKRITGLQVVNNKTGIAASPVRSVVRNFGFLFWVVEIILVIASPSRRIGDFIAGTKVIAVSKPVKVPFPFGQHFFAVLLAFTVAAIMYGPWYFLATSADNSIAQAPQYRSEKIIEKQETTEDLAAFFENKYEKEFQSVVISAQLNTEDVTLVTGSFILKKDLFKNGKTSELTSEIILDLHEKLKGKNFDADISIVYAEGDEPKITYIRTSSGG